jgi:hypothetical protein
MFHSLLISLAKMTSVSKRSPYLKMFHSLLISLAKMTSVSKRSPYLKMFHSLLISLAKMTSVSRTMAFSTQSGRIFTRVSFSSPYTPSRNNNYSNEENKSHSFRIADLNTFLKYEDLKVSQPIRVRRQTEKKQNRSLVITVKIIPLTLQ